VGASNYTTQITFRPREDDGGEDRPGAGGASWISGVDAGDDWTQEVDTTFRLRILVDVDRSSQKTSYSNQGGWEYRRYSGSWGSWTSITDTSTVKGVASSYLSHQDDTTEWSSERLGSGTWADSTSPGTFTTTDSGEIRTGSHTYGAAHEEMEWEGTFQIDSDGVDDGDLIEIRGNWGSTETFTLGYTDTPQITVSKSATPVTLTPGATAITLVAPAPTLLRTLTPGATAIPLVAPAPTVDRTHLLTPGATALPLVAPAPTLLRTLTPGATAITLVTPAPTVQVGIYLTPGATAISLVAPAPTVLKTLTPGATAISLVAPSTTLLKTLTPGATAIPLVAPAPTLDLSRVLTPGATAITLAAPAPTLLRTLTPGPATITLVSPAPVVSVGSGLIITPGATAILFVVPAPVIDLRDRSMIEAGGGLPSELQIANAALLRIGEDTIQSFTSNLGHAPLVNATFALIRDELIRAHPWNFAMQRVELSADATPPVWEFDYAYTRSSDP